MCDTAETDPTITTNAHHDAAPAYDEIIATSQKLVKQSLEAAALVKATRSQLEMYRADAETLGRVKKELSAAGQPVAAPDLTVRELCESEKHLRDGVAIWRKLLDEMGYDKGSIPERLRAVDAALKTRTNVTRPLEVPGYYDLDLTAGDEGCLTKDDSRINAWKRSMGRADRALNGWDIPRYGVNTDGSICTLTIDQRINLLAVKLLGNDKDGMLVVGAAA